MNRIKTLLFASVASALAFSASAATLDFTDTGDSSGLLGTVGWSLTATGGALKVKTVFDAVVPPDGTLAFNYDGAGVGDDEVTNAGESLILKFTQAIFVTGVHILDAYVNKTDPGVQESAILIETGGGQFFEIFADDVHDGTLPAGYAFKAFAKVAVKSITFLAGPGNDSILAPDFALAAIDYAAGPDGQTPAPIPLPAGGVLLLTALAGLAAARRRKA